MRKTTIFDIYNEEHANEKPVEKVLENEVVTTPIEEISKIEEVQKIEEPKQAQETVNTTPIENVGTNSLSEIGGENNGI